VILIINICKEKLHFYEFVKPIADIIKNKGKKVLIVHYKDLTSKEIKNSSKIIICGTSLKDNDFLKDIKYFKWIKNFRKPLFGICGGSHIVGLILGKKIKHKTEIGLKRVYIKKEFLNTKGEKQVYHLHNIMVLPEIFQEKNLYAVLFHPEVRNKKIVDNFLKI